MADGATVPSRLEAIETAYTTIADFDGLARYASQCSRDGFRGLTEIHPNEVPTIKPHSFPVETK